MLTSDEIRQQIHWQTTANTIDNALRAADMFICLSLLRSTSNAVDITAASAIFLSLQLTTASATGSAAFASYHAFASAYKQHLEGTNNNSHRFGPMLCSAYFTAACFGLAGVLVLLPLMLYPAIFTWLQQSPSTQMYSQDFLWPFQFSLFSSSLTAVQTSFFYSIDKAGISMGLSLIRAMFSIGLTYTLSVQMQMGVAGYGLATFIQSHIGFLMGVIIIHGSLGRKGSPLRPLKINHIELKSALLKDFFKQGALIGSTVFIELAARSALSFIAGSAGQRIAATYQVIQNYQSVITMITLGMARGIRLSVDRHLNTPRSQPLIGNIVKSGLKQACGFALISGSMIAALPQFYDYLIMPFIEASNPDFVAIANLSRLAFPVSALCGLVFAWRDCISGALAGADDYRLAGVSSFLCMLLLAPAAGYLMTDIFNEKVIGILGGQAIGAGVGAVALSGLWFRHKNIYIQKAINKEAAPLLTGVS